VRSTKKKRKSLLYTASMSPEMFPSDTITTKLFLMEPRSTTRWDGILGVEIRPEPQEYPPSAEPLVLTVYVRSRSGAVLKRFTREIARPLGDTVEPVTVFEAVKIAPGTHIVSAVLSDPTRAEPIAATQRIDVPAIPRNELFMVGPVLGTPSEDEEFVPLVWGDAARGAPLAALTRICYVGEEMETDEARLARLVRAEGGALTESFDTITVRLASEGRIRCTRQVDWVSTAALAAGTYNLVAFSGSEDRVLGRGNAAFTILP
jgi:hypothetical protein